MIQRLEEEGLARSLSDDEAQEKGLETGDRRYCGIAEKGRENTEEATKEKKKGKLEDLIKGYLKV